MTYKKLMHPALFLFLILIPLLFFNAGSDQQPFVEFSHKPGTYNSDLELAVKKISPATARIFYSFTGSSGEQPMQAKTPLLSFNRTLVLSAVPGERREYRLIIFLYDQDQFVEERQLFYVIDKEPMPLPGIDVLPGIYNTAVSFRFTAADGQSIHYTITTPAGSTQETAWDNNNIDLAGEEGKKITYTVQAYNISASGNKSGTVQYQFIIDKSTAAMIPPAVTVVSPAAGTFANKQSLMLRETNLDWIKYTLDGSDPADKGTYWSTPLLIDKSGSIVLKIAAQPRWTGSALLKSEVKFTVTEESEPLTVDYASGVYTDNLTLKPAFKTGTQFYYSLDGTTPTAVSPVTQSGITLQGIGNAVKDIDCRIRYEPAPGTLSGEYRYLFTIDKREVKNPALSVIKSPGNNTDTVLVQVKVESGTVYYTLNGTTPGRDSAEADDAITVRSTEAGSDGFVLLKTIAYNNRGVRSDPVLFPLAFPAAAAGTGQVSKVRIITEAPQTVSRDITIPLTAGKQYVYRIATDSTPPPDPDPGAPAAAGAIVLSIPPGMEQQFQIKVAEVEKNAIASITEYSYLIDKKPPVNPEIRSLPRADASNEPVTFTFEASSGNIYYQVTDDGSAPKIVANLSPRYASPVTLTGREGADITYRITAIAVDEYGNISPLVTEAKFRINRKNPPVPGAPVLAPYGAEVERKFTLYWEPEGDYSLFYRFTGGRQFSDAFTQFTKPLFVDMAAAAQDLLVECYRQDAAGNKSRTVIFRINEPGEIMKPPVIQGVENYGIYNRKITIRFPDAGGNIRYELATDGNKPDAVKTTSPAAPPELVCDAEEGKTVVYTLRARVFNGNVWDITSGELLLTFTIDKTPPGLPLLTGAGNGGYYYSAREIAFTGSAGDTVFYSLTEMNTADSSAVPSDFAAFKEAFTLEPAPGETGAYRITAFSRDQAGNISGNFAAWSFTIDKKVIFVSGQGSDLSAGTRDNPFRSLVHGLDYAAATGRKVLFLAAGDFPIDRPVKITKDIEIHGGFNSLTWEKEIPEKATRCFSAKPFRGGNPLLEITDCAVHISSVQFTDPLNNCPVLLKQTGGSLVLEKSGMAMNSVKGAGGVQNTQGYLEIRGCELTGRNTSTGTLLQAAGGNVILSGTTFRGADNAEAITCIRITDKCRAILNSITINPGAGKKTIGIEAADANLEILKSRIDSGSGLHNAVAVNLRGSSLVFTKSIINGNAEAGYFAGILADSGDIRVIESLINVTGGKGATGMHITGAGVALYRSYLKAGNTKEFIYMVNLSQCQGSFFNNLIRAADSGDTVCVLLDDVRSQWINNTIIGGKGSSVMSAFMIKGRYTSDIINNIIVHEQFNQGNAIHLVGSAEPDFIITSNNFSGWHRFLYIDFISSSGKVLNMYNPAKYNTVTTAALLNNLDNNPHGGKLHGNIDESYYKIFAAAAFDKTSTGEYHLARSSACIDTGLDIHSLGYSELEWDIDGDKRPARGPGINPAYDIGADEYTGG